MKCENRAKVQIGAELLCKGGKVSAAEGREGTGWLEYGWLGVGRRGLRSSEDGGRIWEAGGSACPNGVRHHRVNALKPDPNRRG
jgi:hypothetical protein